MEKNYHGIIQVKDVEFAKKWWMIARTLDIKEYLEGKVEGIILAEAIGKEENLLDRKIMDVILKISR